MGRSQHRESERLCPGCAKTRSFPERNETCSRECAQAMEAKRRLAADPLRLRKLETENKELREQLREALDRQILDEGYQRFVGAIASRKVRVPDWTIKRDPKSHEVIPVVDWSDWHFDEVVKPEEVQWKNAYNRDIAVQRLKKFTANTIKVAQNYMQGWTYNGLVVNSLGDIFSGSIHDELRRTNVAPVMSSLLFYIAPACAMLRTFADAFGKVVVNCVVGNHGRNSIKPIFKGRVYDNFDWLFMQLVARELASDPRITFQISDAMKLQFKLYQWGFIASHGDECKGGSGIAGMLSPQLIAYSRMKKTYDFEYWLLGHWHNQGAYRGIRVNGCGKGWDEYAAGNNFDFQPPVQDFFLVNQKHGVIASLPVFVSDPEESWRARIVQGAAAA